MQLNLRDFPVSDRWCVHGYYTLCPYAPDGSGRILIAGADIKSGTGEVIVMSGEGAVLHRFGEEAVTPAFWHTGKWQSWSADAKSVYYEAGTHQQPEVVKRDLESGREVRLPGNLEGMPSVGGYGISCAHGMLYAAGYGGGGYRPELSPVPFEARGQHGLWKMSFDPPGVHLQRSTEELLKFHPQASRLRAWEVENGKSLTLMTYCVRWAPDGERFLFFFGNHCVDDSRGEPRLAYVFTADREMKDIHLAMDMGFGRRGVHWGWQPDGEYLIGYGPDPETGRLCLAEVRYDGSDYKKLSDHNSGGHPSVSPADPDLIVTDENTGDAGAVVFISRKTGLEIDRVALPKFLGEKEPGGRNPLRVCHHPVFNQRGDKILCNSLPADGLARMVEIQVGV